MECKHHYAYPRIQRTERNISVYEGITPYKEGKESISRWRGSVGG